MGHFVDGVWKDDTYDPKVERGRFVRVPSRFRNWVTADGAAGPSGAGGFKAEPGRYHLYVAYGCPWAHRTLIFRKLKKLESAISVSIVQPAMGERGWWFGDAPGSIPDTVNGKALLGDIYLLAEPHYTGRVTVPVLWDKEKRTIVNNESSEIIRMFNSAFDAFTNAREDYYPAELRAEIDAINDLVYANVNNGVYRAGFALTQEAYEEAFKQLFGALDQLEARLGRSRYLVGKRVTEADWRLFVTLVRFDAIYNHLFNCNLRRIADYPNLSNYTRELYQVPGVAETVNMDHIKKSYYRARPNLNPLGIIPLGPEQDFTRPHDRARLAGA
jgi:putative glutathione S-transferase